MNGNLANTSPTNIPTKGELMSNDIELSETYMSRIHVTFPNGYGSYLFHTKEHSAWLLAVEIVDTFIYQLECLGYDIDNTNVYGYNADDISRVMNVNHYLLVPAILDYITQRRDEELWDNDKEYWEELSWCEHCNARECRMPTPNIS